MTKTTLKQICCALLFLGAQFATGQVNYTANTSVPAYTGQFAYGSNLGYYSPFTDEQLSDILGGNSAFGATGVGVHSLRPSLPENFLEYWGYDIRTSTFQYYADHGMTENTVFIGYPSAAHRDPTQFCTGSQSQLFANMYLPIWDGGANGTPVNDQNYYALYLYKMVTRYKSNVKFWEVWNEPDLDYSNNGWKPKDVDPANNWWLNNPAPCATAIQAPVFNYIRMLRISYEVIKTLSPDSYVCVGGLGFPSYLDAILRNTDNPSNGSVTSAYPLNGGAYFDCLSFHSYPHIDGSCREWSNAINGFIYKRHSDAAADGFISKKNEFEKVLTDRGYNGQTFPKKVTIVTENNIPRLQTTDYIGSDEASRNYLLKALVMAQKEGVGQFYLYCPADLAADGASTNEFDYMGFYKKPNGTANYSALIKNSQGIAHRTASNLLYGSDYDAAKTAEMGLPAGVRGAAFKTSSGAFIYALWAVTTVDKSETASASYTFPASFGISGLVRFAWDYSETQQTTPVSPTNMALTGSPIFVVAGDAVQSSISVTPTTQTVVAAQNSFSVNLTSSLPWTASSNATWLSSNLLSGAGNATVSISSAANSGTPRTGTITFSNGVQAVSVQVQQGGATLAVSPTSLLVSKLAQSQTITVAASGSWTVTETVNWLTLTGTSGTGNGTFKINVAANNKPSTRTANVTVKMGTLTALVSVSQTATTTVAKLSVSPSVINVNSEPTTSQLSISAEDDWTATTSDSWIELKQSSGPNPLLSGAAVGIVHFEAAENPASGPRIGTIFITAGNLVRTVKVIQEAKPSAGNGTYDRIVGSGREVQPLDFRIAPNPTDGRTSIYLEKMAGKKVSISVSDAFGRQVFFQQIDDLKTPTIDIDLSRESNGVYFVKMDSEGYRAAVKRLIISKL